MLSYVLVLISLLAAYYLGIMRLRAFGIIYLGMLLIAAPLPFIFGVETKPVLLPLIIGLPSMIVTSAAFTALTGEFRIVGVLTVQQWPVEAAAEHPLTLRLMETAYNLGVSPQLLLSLMLNIAGPVAEESWRIVMIHLLTPVMGKKYATVTQAPIFGILHYYAYGLNWTQCIAATTAGLILGLIYMKYHSETSLAVSHIGYNWLALMVG